MDNKRLITAVFCGSLIGDFLPVQLIYKGKTDCCHPHYQFPLSWPTLAIIGPLKLP